MTDLERRLDEQQACVDDIYHKSMELPVGSPQWIKFVCTYQPATPEQLVAYTAINQASQEMMKAIFKHVPACADRSHAIRLVREVRMTANAAVALDGLI